jgi:hypothetical protein
MNTAVADIDKNISHNENISVLADMMDKQIYAGYKLWKTNYIAYDLLFDSEFSNEYTQKEKSDFIIFIEEQIKGLEGDKKNLKEMYLKLYANPVINKKK